ncbi:MAG: carboxypeptidase-like regulatory domain-containing protein, partial [Bacteroidota bacterium]|nr:carboxypeptidase-like regulatory domain-containing protein [Bacteroidota bacterium]
MSLDRLLLALLFLASNCLSGCASSAARHRVIVQTPEPTFRVSGYVLDSVTRKPVPFVLVQKEWGRKGAETDRNGHFAFEGPLRRDKYLRVRTICYNGRASAGKRNADGVTILLQHNQYRLAAHGCATPDSTALNPYATPFLFNWIPGYDLAILIKNAQAKEPQLLRSIRLHGSNSQSDYVGYNQPNLPFIFRIYRADALTGKPMGEVLHGSTLCFPEPNTTKVFDLREYNITIPPGDFV